MNVTSQKTDADRTKRTIIHTGLRPKRDSSLKRWATAIGILVLALVVRVPALGEFLTIDEHRWLDRSRHFVGGLLFADYECPPVLWGRQSTATGWACTFQIGYPGVTTMWGGGLGLLVHYMQAPNPEDINLRNFLETLPVDPLDPTLIAPARLPLAITAALFIPVFYVILRRLVGEKVAFVSALLLALQPFHIANSRVLHHDALTTTLMVLSLLTMIGYWIQGWKRRWLLVSGAMAGLAFLSKPVSWFMIPFAALVGGMSLHYLRRRGEWQGWSSLRQVVGEVLLWAVTAGLTFVALFPAMWVIPTEVIRSLFDITELAQEGHEQYLLGQASLDPGPLFYPIGWLVRASPLEALGLLALLVIAWRYTRSKSVALRHFAPNSTLVALALFLGLFLTFVTLSSKKAVRFFLPAFPVIDVFAALGLLRLANYLTLAGTKLRSLGSRTRRELTISKAGPVPHSAHTKAYLLLVAGVVGIQATIALLHHPYYFTYYNPLLGGGRTAEQLIGIGRGEGLELAADYLNQKPNADQLQVTAWYEQIFAPYFQGETAPFFSIGEAMGSDYLVFYRNQLQRQLPDPDLLAYFQRHYTPEHIVHLKGIDYALIFPVPLQRRTDWQTTNIFDKLILYGYRQESHPPDALTFRLLWENKGMSPQDGLWAALQPCQGGVHSPCLEPDILWQPCALAPGFSEDAQTPGALVESTCQLSTSNLQPGVYSLHIGLGPSPDNRPAGYQPLPHDILDLLAPHGELGVSLPSLGNPALIAPDEALDTLARELLPPQAHPLHASYGGAVALIGYQVTAPPSSHTDHTATATLYWQALQDIAQPTLMTQDFQVRFELITPDGTLASEASDALLALAQTDDLWRSGQVLADPHQVPLPEALPSGGYRLAVALVRATTGEPVPALDEATGLLTTDPIQLGATIDVP